MIITKGIGGKLITAGYGWLYSGPIYAEVKRLVSSACRSLLLRSRIWKSQS